MTNKAFKIYLHGEYVDTVINCDFDAEDTRLSLIEDGYDPAITIEEYEPYKSEDRYDR